MRKNFTAHVIFAATALASQQVWALGFGRAVSDAVLGQSFTFTVPVHVEPSEHFGLECVATHVYYGDATCGSCAATVPSDGGSAKTENRRVNGRSQLASSATSMIGSDTGAVAVIFTSQL